MKLFSRFIFFVILGIGRLSATLPDGSIAPDFTLTDINGQTHHLYDYIGAGKMVVLDFSATWCGNCWNYHNSGALENFYTTYGPAGTDQVRVLFIEIDLATSIDCLYDINCPSSQGNWVATSSYPIINLTSNSTSIAFGITGQPTIYSIGTGGYLLHDPMPSVATLENNLSTIITIPRVQARVLLEGPYNIATHQMNTTLAESGMLPLSQPFATEPFYYNEPIVAATLPPLATEWVLLELRDKNDSSHLIARSAGFLRSDGMLIDSGGALGLTIQNILPDEYYIAIRTLHHLPVISASPVSFPSSQVYDFTTSPSQVFGTDQLYALEPGVYGLFSGDYDGSGVINATDYNLWRQDNAAVNVYAPYDSDANGVINNLDYNIWYKNRSKIAIAILHLP